MTSSTHVYGEEAPKSETSYLPGTTIHNYPPKNENDVQLAQIAARKTTVRAVSTVVSFAVLVSPLIVMILVQAL